MALRTYSAAALLAVATAAGYFELPVWARGGKIWSAELEKEAASPHLGNATPNFFAQLVDHNNPGAGTFQHRYYIGTLQSECSQTDAQFHPTRLPPREQTRPSGMGPRRRPCSITLGVRVSYEVHPVVTRRRLLLSSAL